MVYCNIDDVIDEAKVKPAFFGLATMEELQERVTKWAEEAKSLIDDYCNREFPDFPDEELPLLCDIAMDGDRGICSMLEGYHFNLGKVIAKNEGICEIRIERK